jgi:hypothetical protein
MRGREGWGRKTPDILKYSGAGFDIYNSKNS